MFCDMQNSVAQSHFVYLGQFNAWHFDESNFSTTIMLQKAEKGGDFQHTQPIRAGCGAQGNQVNIFLHTTLLPQHKTQHL